MHYIRVTTEGLSLFKPKFFMELRDETEKQNHVIRKIKRISVAMDRGEFWTIILITGLLGLSVIVLSYYFFR